MGFLGDSTSPAAVGSERWNSQWVAVLQMRGFRNFSSQIATTALLVSQSHLHFDHSHYRLWINLEEFLWEHHTETMGNWWSATKEPPPPVVLVPPLFDFPPLAVRTRFSLLIVTKVLNFVVFYSSFLVIIFTKILNFKSCFTELLFCASVKKLLRYSRDVM